MTELLIIDTAPEKISSNLHDVDVVRLRMRHAWTAPRLPGLKRFGEVKTGCLNLQTLQRGGTNPHSADSVLHTGRQRITRCFGENGNPSKDRKLLF